MSSLQDQLQKAGLVSQEKAKKTQAETRKKSHKLKKDKNLRAEESARQARERTQREAEQRGKRERDRQLNQEREARKRQAAEEARVRQLIESNRLNEADADIPYHFKIGERFVRSIRVTPQQQKLLAMGRIGIVQNIDNDYDFPLLTRETVLKVAEGFADRVLLLCQESAGLDEE